MGFEKPLPSAVSWRWTMRSHRWVLIAVLLLRPAIGGAQAWTPPAGEGTIWMAAQAIHVDAHLPFDGKPVKDLDLKSRSLTVGLEYGVTDRLAIAGSVPYVEARLIRGDYHGGTWDDGSSHATVTDLRLEARYKAVDASVVLTPAISALIPTHRYETLGHAVPGLGLREYAAGFDAGYQAVPISRSLLLQGRFRYTYVQRIDDQIKVDRSNADAQADYLLTTRLTLTSAAMWQRTHGGLNLPFPKDYPKDQLEQHGPHHDQLARVNSWRAAAGITYGLTSDVDLSVSWSTVLSAINAHRFQAWTLGMGSRFKRANANP